MSSAADLSGVVPILLRVLEQGDDADQRIALRALGELGPHSAKAVPVLTALLASLPPGEVRQWQVARALGEIGPAARDAIPVLLDALWADKRIHGPDSWPGALATALILTGAVEVVPALLAAAREADGYALNEWAQIDFRNRGLESAAAMPVLACLATEPGTFSASGWFLSWIGRMSPLRGPDVDGHPHLGDPLGRIPWIDRRCDRSISDELALPATPLLVRVLEAGSEPDRVRAARCLKYVAPARAVPALVRALEQAPTACLCDAVIDALGAAGREAEQAVPALDEVVRGGHRAADRDSAEYAIGALASIGSPEGIPALLEAAEDPDPGGLAWHAVRALRTFGPVAAQAGPTLRRLLDRPPWSGYFGEMLCRSARQALAALGEPVPADPE